ncbi:Adenylate cyclase 1 [Symbiodinium microadriaticum]|uniref:Adenylate cyclase 1 n=1 Tax=Symbiodinium microadriaticum TaxID=2951 RepID=A0A1Q9EEY1_SYMMI|nr:Adenylate cyclase 1 [Symbiodinium microadriaticum]
MAMPSFAGFGLQLCPLKNTLILGPGWEHFEGGTCLTTQARQISPALALERTDLLAAEATRTCCVLSRLVDDCDELPLLEGNRPFFGRPVGEGQGKQKRQRQIKKAQDSVAWFSTTLLQPLRSLVDDMVAMSSLELVGIDDHTAPGTGMLSSKTSKDKIKTAEELENLNTAFRAMRSAIRSWSLFVPPSVVERFYDAGLEVTVLFCDIEGFEETCREMDPDAVLSKLTGVLGTIADEIQLQNGTFLEFISDEVMAVFNAPNKLPNHARCAASAGLLCALAIQKAVVQHKVLVGNQDVLCTSERATADCHRAILQEKPIRGAVAAAAYQAAALRNIGSHQRIKYGLLGDGVNLAARMKGLNTRYGTCTLCSQNALSAQQIPLNLATRPVDLVAVKGKSEPTKVCEVIGFMNEHPSLAEAVKRHQLAFDLYLARKFKEAMEKFEEDAHGPTNTPEAVRLNVGACSQEYMKNPPPPEWVASSLAVLQHVGGYNANSLSWTVAVGKALAQRPLMPPVSWAIHSAYRGRPSELKAKKTRQNFWEAGPRAPGVGFDSCLWHLEGRHLDTTRFGVPQRQKNQIKENIIGNAQQENDAKLAQANGILPAESVESHVLQVEEGDGKDDGSSAKRPCGAGCTDVGIVLALSLSNGACGRMALDPWLHEDDNLVKQALYGSGEESLDGLVAPSEVALSHSPRLGRSLSSVQALWPASYDEHKDLTECIAAWQETGGRTFPDFGRIVSRSPGSTQRLQENGAGRSELFGPALVLNVGGTLFRTTPSTLRKAPFFDSMLRHTVEGGFGATVDSEGHYFVDRSGFLFRYVLEYLRTGFWLLGEKACDLEFIDAIRAEASFYGLEGNQQLPVPRITEYVSVWQHKDDTSIYVDCLEQTIREDRDHQGLFRLCKYFGGLPLDQQTCTKRFKATSHCMQSVLSYFGMRGFSLQHVVEAPMITHVTSADGQSRSGPGTQFMLSRSVLFPVSLPHT